MEEETNPEIAQTGVASEDKSPVESQKTQMKRWIRPLAFTLLGILVAVSLFWGGYKFAQIRQPQVVPTPTPPLTPTSVISPPPITSPTPTPSVPLKRIDILPTEGWKTVYQSGVSFKIPPEAICKADSRDTEEDIQNCKLIYFGPDDVIPSQVSVSEYRGGSKREQFFENFYLPEGCKWIFEDAYFGEVRALQIAAEESVCGSGIVAVIGDKFVVFPDLFYNSDTKVIYRSPSRDTVISTLQRIK